MTYQWRRLQFFDKTIVNANADPTQQGNLQQQRGGQGQRPLRIFDSSSTSLTCTTSGSGFVFAGDNKGFVHRFIRQHNVIDKFQAFDSICLHLRCIPTSNILVAIGFDHDPIDTMFNPTLKLFKYNPNNPTIPTPQQLQQQQQMIQERQQANNNNNNNNNNSNNNSNDQQWMTNDLMCIRTIPLCDYLNPSLTTTAAIQQQQQQNKLQQGRNIDPDDAMMGRRKLITVTCFTVSDDCSHIALGCDDGSIITLELTKQRCLGHVWFRKSPGQQQQQQSDMGPEGGAITTIYFRPSSTNNFLSLYLTTIENVYIVHYTRTTISCELLSPGGCHYYGASLCTTNLLGNNNANNNNSSIGYLSQGQQNNGQSANAKNQKIVLTSGQSTSPLGEYVIASPELTSFYATDPVTTETDRLSCYLFTEHKKFILFYNQYLIIISEDGMGNNNIPLHVANNPNGSSGVIGGAPPTPTVTSSQQQQQQTPEQQQQAAANDAAQRYLAKMYNSPMSKLGYQPPQPAIRNNMIIYDIQNKLIVFTTKCDNIVGCEVLGNTLNHNNNIGTTGLINQLIFITQRGELMLLTELPLRNKMNVLLRRELYSVALSLAHSQNNLYSNNNQQQQNGQNNNNNVVMSIDNKKLIIDITYKYGDYLYNKGDYDTAISYYVDTIGYIEPSTIITKFLHSQRISSLTIYLEALHNNRKHRHLITTDHTTLLLTCYTKLRDLLRLTTFLTYKYNILLSTISSATPIEHLKSIEYCRVYCNSLKNTTTYLNYNNKTSNNNNNGNNDGNNNNNETSSSLLQSTTQDLDELSKLTHIGEYLVYVLTSSNQYYRLLNNNNDNNNNNNEINNDNNSLVNINNLTTIYNTKTYNTLIIYNIINVAINCHYFYHALFISFLLGAHEYVVILLLQLGFFTQAIAYINSLPINLALWLTHQYGNQLIQHYPEEMTMCCIKLICGWKRQTIIHNIILTIQQDITTSSSSTTTTTNTSTTTANTNNQIMNDNNTSSNGNGSLSTEECYATIDTIYGYDQVALQEHYEYFLYKQKLTKQKKAYFENQQNQNNNNIIITGNGNNNQQQQLPFQQPPSSTTTGNNNKKDNNLDFHPTNTILDHHIYLRIAIADDGCIQVLKFVGLDGEDLTGYCNTMGSNLLHYSLKKIDLIKNGLLSSSNLLLNDNQQQQNINGNDDNNNNINGLMDLNNNNQDQIQTQQQQNNGGTDGGGGDLSLADFSDTNNNQQQQQQGVGNNNDENGGVNYIVTGSGDDNNLNNNIIEILKENLYISPSDFIPMFSDAQECLQEYLNAICSHATSKFQQKKQQNKFKTTNIIMQQQQQQIMDNMTSPLPDVYDPNNNKPNNNGEQNLDDFVGGDNKNIISATRQLFQQKLLLFNEHDTLTTVFHPIGTPYDYLLHLNNHPSSSSSSSTLTAAASQSQQQQQTSSNYLTHFNIQSEQELLPLLQFPLNNITGGINTTTALLNGSSSNSSTSLMMTSPTTIMGSGNITNTTPTPLNITSTIAADGNNNNIVNSNVNPNTLIDVFDTNNNMMNVVCVNINTTIWCDDNIWTALIELYAEYIKLAQQQNNNNTQNQQQQQNNNSQNQQQQQQKSSNNNNNNNNNIVTINSTPNEIENIIINIIKINFEHIDQNSILILLEQYQLITALTYYYTKLRQYHSLLHLYINRQDWERAMYICQAYGSQETSLWLFFLVKIIDHYPPSTINNNNNNLNNNNDTALDIFSYNNVNSNILNNLVINGDDVVIQNNNNNNNNQQQQQQNEDKTTVLLPMYLQQVITKVQQTGLLSPLQILSLISTSPYIPIQPIRTFLLNIIDNIQNKSINFTNDVISYAEDCNIVQNNITTLQYEPLVFKSIDCQRCKSPLTMPTIHFYCGHSFHQQCVIENEIHNHNNNNLDGKNGGGTGNHQQGNNNNIMNNNNIAQLYDLMSSAQPLHFLNKNANNQNNINNQSLLLVGGNNNHVGSGSGVNNNNTGGDDNQQQQNNLLTTTSGGISATTYANNNNPYSLLLNNPTTCLTEYLSQQLILNMYNNTLQYECPLCQVEHQRLSQLATVLFGTQLENQQLMLANNNTNNNEDNNKKTQEQQQLEFKQKQALQLQQIEQHEKFLKKLDDNNGQFGLIAEQLSRGVFLPQDE